MRAYRWQSSASPISLFFAKQRDVPSRTLENSGLTMLRALLLRRIAAYSPPGITNARVIVNARPRKNLLALNIAPVITNRSEKNSHRSRRLTVTRTPRANYSESTFVRYANTRTPDVTCKLFMYFNGEINFVRRNHNAARARRTLFKIDAIRNLDLTRRKIYVK